MFTRYAIYYTASGPFAEKGAAWLGWDIARGIAVSQPEGDRIDLTAVTARPVKYGFHGTIKAPFFLANGETETALRDALVQFCDCAKAARMEGLQIALLGRFLAFVPTGDTSELKALAASVVRDLDSFRARASEAELARRRKANLSTAQESNLLAWGYPHVMDNFRFHMTLSGPLPSNQAPALQAVAAAHFAGVVPEPPCIDALSLVGERADGRWQVISRVPLQPV